MQYADGQDHKPDPISPAAGDVAKKRVYQSAKAGESW